MNNCICCHDSLLRYVRRGELYWFCPGCRQEMPNIEVPSMEGTNIEVYRAGNALAQQHTEDELLGTCA